MEPTQTRELDLTTLVGITALHFPDFWQGERIFMRSPAFISLKGLNVIVLFKSLHIHRARYESTLSFKETRLL